MVRRSADNGPWVNVRGLGLIREAQVNRVRVEGTNPNAIVLVERVEVTVNYVE